MPFQNKPKALQLEMILDNLDMAIALVDRSGQLIYWNDVYLQMLKCTTEEFKEKYQNTNTVFGRGDLDHSFFQEVMKTKKKAEGCQKLRALNGDIQYLYATHLPIFDSEGEVAYSLGIIQYIHRIKKQYFRAIKNLEKAVDASVFQVTVPTNGIVYHGSKMAALIHTLENIARTDATVLLMGETGTGKELFARFVHNNSRRADKKMITVNCAAIPADLFEAELFGYESGAFTGAAKGGKKGLIEEANGGTLFLDEINSMPLVLQSKLLRTLEEKTIQHVGSTRQIPIDFRLVAASNKDLMDCVRNNTFRMDLYFRLNVASLEIPALRERPEDIPSLVERFADECTERYERQKIFSPQALEQLKAYHWPGNVRELRNLIERIFLITDPAQVEINTIADSFFSSRETSDTKKSQAASDTSYLIPNLTFEENLEYYERRLLKEALEEYHSPKAVEEKLGISHATLFRKLNKYNLKRYTP